MGDARDISCLAISTPELMGGPSVWSETPIDPILHIATNISDNSAVASVQHHNCGEVCAVQSTANLQDGNAHELLDCLDGFDSDALAELEDTLDLKSLRPPSEMPSATNSTTYEGSPLTSMPDKVSDAFPNQIFLLSPCSGAGLQTCTQGHKGDGISITCLELQATSACTTPRGRNTWFPTNREFPPCPTQGSQLFLATTSQSSPKYNLRKRVNPVSYRAAESESDEETPPVLLRKRAKKTSGNLCQKQKPPNQHNVYVQTGHITPAGKPVFPMQSVVTEHTGNAACPEALGDDVTSPPSSTLGSKARRQPRQPCSRTTVPELPSPQPTACSDLGSGTARKASSGTARKASSGTAQKSPLKQRLADKIRQTRVEKGQQPIEVDFTPSPAGELTEEEKIKVDNRKRRNVLSAQRSRDRKRNVLEDLEKERQTLMAAHRELDVEVDALEKESQLLKNALAAHQGNCQLQQPPAHPKSSQPPLPVQLISRLGLQPSYPATPPDKVFNTWESQAFE